MYYQYLLAKGTVNLLRIPTKLMMECMSESTVIKWTAVTGNILLFLSFGIVTVYVMLQLSQGPTSRVQIEECNSVDYHFLSAEILSERLSQCIEKAENIAGKEMISGPSKTIQIALGQLKPGEQLSLRAAEKLEESSIAIRKAVSNEQEGSLRYFDSNIAIRKVSSNEYEGILKTIGLMLTQFMTLVLTGYFLSQVISDLINGDNSGFSSHLYNGIQRLSKKVKSNL